jgi:phosphopantothenoylcysteine decarboxylase/phosphopantothenate--cysteine ligase
MMSRAATHFIGPLTMETLSGRPVMLDPLELQADRRISHIVAADAADAVLVAPATARWLGAMANGLADDIITATCLATSAPVVVAPAMDGDMYAHPATVANVATLRNFGIRWSTRRLVPASGQVGVGRSAELPVLVDAVAAVIRDRPGAEPDLARRPTLWKRHVADMAGWHIVVSAGGTAEAIDPVRFIGNRSSGRMGFAIAEAASGRQVTLIKGITQRRIAAGAGSFRRRPRCHARGRPASACRQ